ncbi:MAG: DNA-binding protein [Candidatus Eisenbacteria bacterium]|uniref:DNA-binding protein n=1 Tax=Eiseniibacteriota bacterium TaxID=2212470 RepID=A0A938BNW8_UNCEI|nr:DNA-binding protein [Candidatus Eisenbacteria bacterium]
MKAQTMDGCASVRLLVFAEDDEVLPELTAYARSEGIGAAHFTGIGAFSGATLGHFDPATRVYGEIVIDRQVEVIALTGNIGLHDGAPRVHAHALVGLPDGSTRAGHLVAARVRPTLELFVTVLPGEIRRRMDEASGLPLINPD